MQRSSSTTSISSSRLFKIHLKLFISIFAVIFSAYNAKKLGGARRLQASACLEGGCSSLQEVERRGGCRYGGRFSTTDYAEISQRKVNNSSHKISYPVGSFYQILCRINLVDFLDLPIRYNTSEILPDVTRMRNFYSSLVKEKLQAARERNLEKNPTGAMKEATLGLQALFIAAKRQQEMEGVNNQTLAELLCERGQAFTAFQEWHLGLRDFSTAMKVKHKRMNKAYFSAGICMSALDRHDEAVDVWQELLKLPDADYHRLALYWLNKTDELRKHQQLSLPSRIVKNELETIAFRKDNCKLAIEEGNYTEALIHLNGTLDAAESMISKIPDDQAADARKLQVLLEYIRNMILNSYVRANDKQNTAPLTVASLNMLLANSTSKLNSSNLLTHFRDILKLSQKQSERLDASHSK
mmetsp:Transcript_1748/g.2401  ORF Transcript_1748/g.2401 Transcript_1748/m.2401 type:complete len:412 (-) Transcript_1748:44-1279(-)